MPLTATRDFSLPSKQDIPDDFGKGRRCLQCNAYLCRYNASDVCWCHQPDGDGILIETMNGWKKVPLYALISRQKLSELVPNRG